MKNIFIYFFFSIFLTAAAISQDNTWLTYFEQSKFLCTPRYDETMAFCRKLEQASPWVKVTSFGKTARLRDLPLVIVDKSGNSDPVSIRKSGKLVILIQACIHPGECEGKDAGLMLLRDMVIHKKHLELLDHCSILFIPIFNVDGHERFGPYNRINQNGPEEMGWRVTANNRNLNRDYLKADTPEIQAWLKMFQLWLPDFFVDCHTTDGADYQYALTYALETGGNMDPGLTKWTSDIFEKDIISFMQKEGYDIFPYVWFREWHNPKSGLASGVSPPMLSQGYTAVQNRPGLLIETHMLKNYKIRVFSTYSMLLGTMKILDRERDTLQQFITKADRYTASPSFRSQPYPLDFTTDEHDSTMITFLGIGYDMEKSDLTGGTWFKYNGKPENMSIPYYNHIKPAFTVNLPEAYIIPVEWSDVISKLELHGIAYKRLAEDTRIRVQTFRLKKPKWQEKPYEGRHPLRNIEYDVAEEELIFPAGSAVVFMEQRTGRLIPYLLEPKGDGSLLSWGFFDAIFEQKEYSESYVMESMAREMLAKDPELKQEFETKKAQDTAFAKDPEEILNWFYMKTPYGDNHKNLYPIGRILDAAILGALPYKKN